MRPAGSRRDDIGAWLTQHEPSNAMTPREYAEATAGRNSLNWAPNHYERARPHNKAEIIDSVRVLS